MKKGRFKLPLKTTILLGMIIILLPLALFSLFKPGKTEALWMDDSWAYRTSLTFTHNATVSSATKVKFDIDTATLITAGKMQSDCGDSRFTDLNGKVLPYYIDTAGGACNTSSTDYYVLIPSIINGTNVIYHYYGNTAASDGSVSAQFSQSTTTPSGGAASSGSEEKGTGPAAYWSFDDGTGTTAHDETANSNTGTLGGSTLPTWQNESMCVSSKCLFFDGSTSVVTVSNTTSINPTTAITLSAWVRPTDWTAGNRRILQKGDSDNQYRLMIESGSLKFIVQNSANGSVTAPSLPTLNAWHQIVGVYDSVSGRIELWIDGVMVAGATNGSGTIATQTDSLTLGNKNGSGTASDHFYGYMDEPKIYPYALSAAQIKANYNSRGTGEGSSAIFGDVTQKALSDGLVGYWKMDESSANTCSGGTNDNCDSSGNGNDGAWNGNATTTTGKFGAGVTFDGSGDYVKTPDINTLISNSSPFTISAWVNPTTVSSTGAILGHYSGNTFDFAINSSGGLYYEDQSSSYNSTSSVVTANTWNHVLITHNGSNTVRFYVNGVYISSSTTASVSTSGSTTSLGHAFVGDFSGKMDDVRIYKRELTGQEVKNLYNWAPGPVGYWKMDENTGTTAYDNSGNGLNGTLTNSPSWTTGKYGAGIQTTIANSSHQNITVSDNSLLDFSNTQEYTTSIWFKASAFSNSLIQPLVKSYYIQIDTNQNRCVYDADGVIGGSGIIDSQWHYVTCVMDRDGKETGVAGLSLYIDGKYMGSDTTLTGTDQSGSSASLTLGETSWDMDGSIDEAKIYNYARTPQQIVEDMNGGHPTGGSPVGSYVSYWRMDETNGTTANDYNSTNANSLTLSAASWDAAGKTNSAWKGVGTNWLSRADDDDFDLTASDNASISMWFKSTSATNPAATEYLFAKGRGTPPGYALYLNTSGFLCWSIDDDASWTPDDTACTTTDVYDGTWHHVVAEKTSTTEIRLYLDGRSTAADTSLAATGTLANSGTIYVGDDDGDSTNSFNGDIDEVKFYRSALTTDQIALDINAGSSINFGSTASTEASTLSDGAGNAPVGWWKLDERTGTSTVDSSGNANTGTLTNGPVWVAGKYGAALSFDGSDDVVDVGSASLLDDLGPMTAEAWVYPKSLGEGGLARIFEKQATVNTLGWRLQLNTNNSLIFAQDYATTDLSQNTADNTLTLNAWNHVAVTWDGTTTVANVHVYINGSEVSYSSSTNGSGARQSDAAQTLKIGNTTDGTRTFDGIIDDAKIYSYVRTKAQVAYDYNRGGPVGYWRLDECQGSTVNDSSGNGNSGTVTVGASGTQTSVGTCNTSSTAWGNGASGKFNSALNFDGTDDYVACTDASCGGTTKLDFGISAPFSYGAWINTSSAASKIVLSKKDGTTSGSAGYLLQLSASNFAVCRISDGTTQVSPTDTIALNDSAWHFVMCVHNGSTLSLYVDGKLRVSSSTASVTGTLDNASDFRVGTTGTPSSNYFSGLIDDVRVYNYALSQTQIQKVYEGNSGVYFGPASGQP